MLIPFSILMDNSPYYLYYDKNFSRKPLLVINFVRLLLHTFSLIRILVNLGRYLERYIYAFILNQDLNI